MVSFARCGVLGWRVRRNASIMASSLSFALDGRQVAGIWIMYDVALGKGRQVAGIWIMYDVALGKQFRVLA